MGRKHESTHAPERRLTGAPGAPPGMLISITELRGMVYTEPVGRSDCAVFAPPRTWSRTGTDGGTKENVFTVNEPPVNAMSNGSGMTVPLEFSALTAGPGAAGSASG